MLPRREKHQWTAQLGGACALAGVICHMIVQAAAAARTVVNTNGLWPK